MRLSWANLKVAMWRFSLAMGEAILELGREVGLPMPALTRLMETLRARPR